MLVNVHKGKRVRGNLLLAAMVLIMVLLNFYSKTIFFRPMAMHQWRQSDCLSITKNYYEEGMNFFEPKIHFQGVKDGKAVSEFPILNYTVACLWKIFGEHEFIYRLLEYLIFITAVFFLFDLLLSITGSVTWGLMSCGLLLTSPLFAYYGLNFIADVPAFSVGLIAFCLFTKAYYTGGQGKFYAAVFFGTLAVLMKASALTALAITGVVALADVTGASRYLGLNRFIRNRVMALVALVISAAVVFSWYAYALSYNDHYTNNIFLLTVLPIWEMTDVELFTSMRMLFNIFLPYFLNRPMLFLFFSAVIFVLVNFTSLDGYLRISFVLALLFFILYLIFFFQVFNQHDYYLCNLMILPVITFLSLCFILSKRGYLAHNRRFVNTILTLIFIFNSVHCAALYRIRMVDDDKIVHWYPFISEDEKQLGKYHFWFYEKSMKNVEHFTPQLRKLGIRREDRVLSLPDFSFNITLYLMDQKGFTIASDHFIHDTTVADRFFKKDIKYVIMNDTSMKHYATFRRIAPRIESMGIYNRVEVFRVKK